MFRSSKDNDEQSDMRLKSQTMIPMISSSTNELIKDISRSLFINYQKYMIDKMKDFIYLTTLTGFIVVVIKQL